jgi:hypothetical protein
MEGNKMKSLRYVLAAAIILTIGIFCIRPASSQTAPTSNNTFYNVRYGNVGIGTFTANPGTYATIYTAPTAGAMLKGVIASNLDTSTAHVVTCKIVNGSSVTGLVFPSSSSIAAQSGSVAPFNMFSSTIVPGLPVDQWGNPFIYMPSGYTLQCTYTTALSNNYVAVTAIASEF